MPAHPPAWQVKTTRGNARPPGSYPHPDAAHQQRQARALVELTDEINRKNRIR